MEGKVELPIERYEELTKIERDGFAKVKELEANMDVVIIHHKEWYEGVIQREYTEYKPRSEVFQKLIDARTKAVEAKDKAIGEKEAVIQKYNEASFWKRFKYLWTGGM